MMLPSSKSLNREGKTKDPKNKGGCKKEFQGNNVLTPIPSLYVPLLQFLYH
jgi:hypothetical protein